MGPFIGSSSPGGYAFLGQSDDAKSLSLPKDPGTLTQDIGDFRSVEELQRETKKNRIEAVVFKRKPRSVSECESDPFRKPGLLYSLS
jgi:hypothetical protein